MATMTLRTGIISAVVATIASSALPLSSATAADKTIRTTSEKSSSPNLTVDESLKEARERVLSNRPYKLDRYQRISNLQLSIAPVALKTELTPDWWSEKQAYDLSKLIEEAMGYYPGLKVKPGLTWESVTVQKELGDMGTEAAAKTRWVPSLTRTEEISTIQMQPTLTNYQYQLFKPKRQGIGLVFIAITSKSCKSESFAAFRAEFQRASNNENFSTGFDSSILTNGFDISRLKLTESGGTSLNVNAIVAGAGGGDFKPPEKATKELLYDSIVDMAEGTYCTLAGIKECIAYYQSRVQSRPTPPKKDRRGRPIQIKPQDLKC